MTRRHGTVPVYLLRKRLVDGLISHCTAPAHRLCGERSTAKPVLKETAEALPTFEKRFLTVDAYVAAKEDAVAHGEFLPKWYSIAATGEESELLGKVPSAPWLKRKTTGATLCGSAWRTVT